MRDILIGDIHGCRGAYLALLNRLSPDPARDRLILLGDLFDRGPDSWEVFQAVREQEKTFGDRFIMLRGNHEDYLLRPRLSLFQRLMWNRVGRKATVRSFRFHGDSMESAIPWLKDHCLMYWKGNGFQCAHAGVKAEPIEVNDAETLLHDHQVVMENRYAGPLTVTGHIALRQAAYFPGDGENVEILPEEAARPLPEKGVICIDSGCGKGGRLTAMVIENGLYQLFSVPERE
ncbi:MAG: serine/threonine protein phosphatase [Clostridia bacterium]|nr:serine/threonine protein phosphatase [Clostridia bacterium]